MATPPDHPSWWEMIFGGSVLIALGPRLLEAFRVMWSSLVRGNAQVRVAELEDDAKFRGDLMTRISHLEAAAEARETRLARVEAEQDNMRRQISSILFRGEQAIGGEPGELVVAMRLMVQELREVLGRDPYPKSVMIGDSERTQGTG